MRPVDDEDSWTSDSSERGNTDTSEGIDREDEDIDADGANADGWGDVDLTYSLASLL